MKKFIVMYEICEEGMIKINKEADVCVANNGNPKEYKSEMENADGILVRVGSLDKEDIKSAKNLKVIGRTGVGYDMVDVDTATKLGIPVVITPGANNRSVAEHTVALILASSKNIVSSHNEMLEGNFTAVRDSYRAFEYLNKKVAFIGLGNIGYEAAKMCKALDMNVLVYDPYVEKSKVESRGYVYYEDYEDMLKEADFITIHVPLTKNTRNMISEKQINMMKKNAILINCSRGGIVNEDDLINALNSGTIAGAALDVFGVEPTPSSYKLINTKNVICTPHMAALTKEATITMAEMCIDGCIAIMNGEKWPFVVDKKVYEHPRWADKEEALS